MKKRAGLARALVLDPDIVMFDEPDSGLDPVRTAFLSELIRDLNAQIGMTSVVVTHDIATTRRVADYIGMIARQHLVKFGTAKEMFESDHPVVRQFLAGDTEGPIGMAEEKDQDILGEEGADQDGESRDAEPGERESKDESNGETKSDQEIEARSSAGMKAEETEEMERDAGAPDEDERARSNESGGKQGSGLPEDFSLEDMLRSGGEGSAEEA
jgi:phospholipid/cholesterol/gamma-HCH transport system ATP-binding protein